MAATTEPPFLVALNLTRRCNLKCAHCYLDAGTLCNGAPDELATEEVLTLLDGIASLSGETMVVLTGGEPLLRPGIETIARRGAGLGPARRADIPAPLPRHRRQRRRARRHDRVRARGGCRRAQRVLPDLHRARPQPVEHHRRTLRGGAAPACRGRARAVGP